MDGVVVAHPGTHHSYELAFGLHQTGLLARYVTGFYYSSGSILSQLLTILSYSLEKTTSRVTNRCKPDLPLDRIVTFPIPELAYAGAVRLRFGHRNLARVLEWRNDRFDAFVAQLIQRIEPAAVTCYDSSALKAFQQMERIGGLRVLDQVIGHIKTGVDALKEEVQRDPEFADGEDISISLNILDRCTDEALHADIVLAGSEYVRDTLVAHGVSPTRVVVVPYGVDTARFVPSQQKEFTTESFRILFAGHIGLRKGVRYLLDAVKEIGNAHFHLTLVGLISGSGRGLARYSGHFTHIPHLPHREMAKVLRAADVFVLPSLHEGSAYSIYEALACGVPVITTPNSGSVVRDGIDGFIIPVRDVAAMKERLLLLSEDLHLREWMGRNARMRAEQFTWDRYHRTVARVFEERLGRVTAAANIMA
jgi:starch synthase